MRAQLKIIIYRLCEINDAGVFSEQYRAARKWRGSYQRSTTIVRITRGYLSCNDSA